MVQAAEDYFLQAITLPAASRTIRWSKEFWFEYCSNDRQAL